MNNANVIVKRRQFVATAQSSPIWAIINLTAFLFFFFDFNYLLLSSFFYFDIIESLLTIFDLAFMALFFINFAYNLYLLAWVKKIMQPIELTENEFALFGIDTNELGFRLKKDVPKIDVSPIKKPITTFPATPPFEFNTCSILDKHPSLDSTALSTRFLDSSLDSTATSWSFIQQNSGTDSLSKLMNKSANLNKSNNELKLRKSNSFLMNLSQQKSTITSQDELKRYLSDCDERTEQINELVQSQKRFISIVDSSPIASMIPSHFTGQKGDSSLNSPYSSKNQSFGGSPFNKSNLIVPTSPQQANSGNSEQKLVANTHEINFLPSYQPAIKVSTLPSSPEKSESITFSHTSPKTLEKILSKLEIDDSRLNQMVENIRKWISQTILVRLAEEIDSINKQITEKGLIDSLVGEITIKQLKQLAINKKTDFPTLEQLCTFLDINVRGIENNVTLQQYLVRRIKDLAKSGCITEFLWDGGGSYNYKRWKEDMLTDSEIILHLFCVYMDSRLLYYPTIPEGKPFTSQHIKLCSVEFPKSDTYIHQVKTYPPHYSLILKGESFDLPPGRNNLFYALLVFLQHVKTKKNFGLFGYINLGPPGLNIAWVIEK